MATDAKGKITVGVLPLARPTFDVPYAEEMLRGMLEALAETGATVVGDTALLFDGAAASAAIEALRQLSPDGILILQTTFTDAVAASQAAAASDQRLAIWAVPEPRGGGRLRLNAFCGLNLAAHALGLRARDFGYLYAAPDADGVVAALGELLAGQRQARPVPTRPARGGGVAGATAAASLKGARIGRIGQHPDGFDTCAYDRVALDRLAGVAVDELDLGDLFDRARGVGNQEAANVRREAEELLIGLGEVDQPQLDRSLRLKAALAGMGEAGRYDALAIRCWPETFTEYGGAVCGPVSMMGEAKVPCACEADVYGALTQLLLQRVANAPVFLADLVDIDLADDTGVVWHCGQAPVSMASEAKRPRATIHTNRRMPLLFEFPLKPGRVTFFRISQARGETFAVIGGGAMLERPMAFTGTSGVVRFDSGAAETLDRVMGAALEHHMAIAYGDHRDALDSAAAELGLRVLDL